jgi:hypothetical protein
MKAAFLADPEEMPVRYIFSGEGGIDYDGGRCRKLA